MRSRTVLAILSVSLLAGQHALAAPSKAREREAKKACLSGDYVKGVSILADLYLDTNDPIYLFNQGRCYEQNIRYSEAAERFREHLRKSPKLSDSDRADVEKHIADCVAAAKSQGTPAAPSPTPAPAQPQPAGAGSAGVSARSAVAAPAVAPQPATPAPATEAVPPIVQQTNPHPVNGSGSGLRTAGIITAAFGGAAVVAGIILNLKVNSMASDMQKTNGYTDSKDADRKTYETLGWAGYGVGAACVATGAVLYYLGARSGAAGTASVALVPAFAPGQAGAIVKGAF